jgi:butyrate kinase
MKTKYYYMLVIYPDPRATTVALFKNTVLQFLITIDGIKMRNSDISDRVAKILDILQYNNIDCNIVDAIVGRGGLTRGLESGIYSVNRKMVEELLSKKYGYHESNYGAILAFEIGQHISKPAYIVDPVTLDELDAIAKVSGLPGVQRQSFFHALAQKTAARRAAFTLGKEYEECNFIAAHLGVGVSVGVHRRGKVVDVNNAINESSFSIERAGRLPVRRLIELCYSGRYQKEQLIKKIEEESGIYAHLGTKDIGTVDKMIRNGDKKARLILHAMVYQLAKEIGAYATVLQGDIDGVVVSGPHLRSKIIPQLLREYVSYLGPIFIYPEEIEVSGLAEKAYELFMGEEVAKEY